MTFRLALINKVLIVIKKSVFIFILYCTVWPLSPPIIIIILITMAVVGVRVYHGQNWLIDVYKVGQNVPDLPDMLDLWTRWPCLMFEIILLITRRSIISAECSIPISSGWCLCRLLYDGWLIWKFSNCVTLWQTDASQSNVSTFCLPAPVSARPPSDFSPFNTGCPRPGTPEVMYAEKDNNDRRDLIEEILHNFSNFLLNHNTTVS